LPTSTARFGCSATLAYARRWSAFHTRPGTRWEDDPEVVVVSFEVASSHLAAATERHSMAAQ
jgi:hypothetical protein